ncbi:hypothetical protein IAU60_002606 [Kwoniella sp. DSM 27419]
MPPTPRTTAAGRPTSRRTLQLPILLTLLIPLLALFSQLYLPTRTTSDLLSLATLVGDNTEATGKALSALVLTAHPDDEVMFFSPTILGLLQGGWDVNGLCLSSGNSSGLGETRKEELMRSYEVLGVDKSRVKLIEHPELRDSMTEHWDPKLVAGLVDGHLAESPVSLIITFDEKGITHHPNHMVLPLALAHLRTSPPPRTAHLRSPSTLAKFTGPLYPLYLRLSSRIGHSRLSEHQHSTQPLILISSTSQWAQSIRAMMSHQSQLVWFRWLYLAASRLMWVNELVLGGTA